MSTSRPSLTLASAALLTATLAAQGESDLRTVAEKSDWQATSTHAEVMQLCSDLAASSPLIHMETVGETFEKKALPILVIADPPVSSPAEVGDRLVAFAWAGIHSGEVCGKPATLMLAREMASTENHPLLENLVVVFLPLLNADGNDRMDPSNRRGQVGPVQGMGTRPNAQGLNINRDWTKLDTSEAVAVINVLNSWDPVIAMDLHTTNGTRHRYTLTYDGQRHPACDDDLRKLTRYDLLPSVTWSMERATGYRTTVYGNLNRDRTRWTIDAALPRYSTHYVGMRHHISILSEAYSYAEYKDRVMATLAFVRHSFQWVSDHAEQVRSTIQAAKDRTVALGNDPQGEDMLPLRRQPKYSEATINILAYDGDVEKDYQCFYNDLSEATHSVPRPWAYLLPARYAKAVKNLQQHGIDLQVLTVDSPVEVEVYKIDSMAAPQSGRRGGARRGAGRAGRRGRGRGAASSPRSYEGHQLNRITASKRLESMTVPAGTIVVRTAQSLGTLAAFLLEPECEDGLATWNFFDEGLADGSDFPVLRLPGKVSLQTSELR